MRTLRSMRWIRWTCLVVTFGAVGWSQGPARTNPFDNADGVAQGRALFQIHCSYCHGANGEGGRGADLTTGRYRRGGSDANLYISVRNGIPGTEMPAVRATDDEVWKMVAFVKRLGSAAPTEKAAGNAAAGKLIFETKGKCLQCHAVGPSGGNLGPDLSDVGRRRSLNYLAESIVNPDADVAIPYRSLEVVTTAGEAISGVRLNEDDLSIQLRDTSDNLRSFLKSNVREVKRGRPSLMPAFASVLAKQEIEDVVAYLSSLRGVE
jgi:putative heme-binding domain-containing protein